MVSTMGKKTMNKIKIAFIFLVFASLACGTQIPTQTSTEVKQPTSEAQTVSLAAIAEPTDTAPVYMTTGALNVRSEPNADSTILGTLEPLTEIQIFITDIQGDDCFGGEWYAITSPIEGFVCSLWVVRK